MPSRHQSDSTAGDGADFHANRAAYHLLGFWPPPCDADKEERRQGDGTNTQTPEQSAMTH